MKPTRQIAVIGAGPTGLSAAYRIAKSGHGVRVFEAAPRVGGSVRSVRENGWLVESGPNSILETSAQIAALWRELGIESDRIVANPRAKKRYIVRDDELRALPSSPWSLFTTRCWSGRSTRRLFADLFRKPVSRPQDVSIGMLIEDHFGREIVDYALNPFVSGIYAGDPNRLSAQHAFPRVWSAEKSSGSIVRGLAKLGKARREVGHPKSAMISFRRGLQQIIDALVAGIPAGSIELSANVHRLRRENARWTLAWQKNDGAPQTETFDAVVAAIPAGALAQLSVSDEASAAVSDHPLESLAQIRYSAVASLFLGFPRSAVRHPLDGFGLLAPAIERRSILGVIFSSSLFPERVPDTSMVGLTVMIGGAGRPDLVNHNLEALLPEIMPELRDLLGVSGEPVYQKLTRWPQAIPQYELGYERFLADIAAVEARYPGLHVAGNVRNGIALPACIEAGLAAAAQAVSK